MKQAILAMALFFPLPAFSEAITLDTSRSVGPTVSIITPSGISCSETAGDRPSVWIGGRLREQTNANQNASPLTDSNNTYINSNLFNDEQGYSVGVGIHIPFGGPPTGNCKRFIATANAEAYLLVLDNLLAKKVLTFDEYTTLAKQVIEDFNEKQSN
jgi:hypothetical protein